MKNIAGHDMSIFLFRFDLSGNGISFVLNQAIASDMYDDVDEQLKPLAHACGETLLRYKRWSVNSTIMDCSILATGECEAMLSRGLGKYIPEAEKERLFEDARQITELLTTVMDRRTKEEKAGKRPSPAKKPAPDGSRKVKQGLERLGQAERLQAELEWLAEGKQVRPGLKRLRPEDLPTGVRATRSYDHRGHCLMFAHDALGELGKIVLIKIPDGQMLIHAELFVGQVAPDSPLAKDKQRLFEQVVATVDKGFQENFPD